MQNLILIGGGGHCKACLDVITSTGQYNVIGVLDTFEKIGQKMLNCTIIGTDEDIEGWVKKDCLFLITVGQIKSSALRTKLYTHLKQHKAPLATVISKYAIVSKYSIIGKGSIVMHQAVVNVDSQIGDNSIINTNAIVEHDVKIGNHTHVSTGAIINGNCQIGNHVFIGSQTVIAQGISICDNVVIGAGSTILKSIDTEGVYVGSPAKRI
ncbi:MAG: acetyltransferase [Rhodothermia bacterium]|nr:acetyltransferase [Rhodothermia bacterium]